MPLRFQPARGATVVISSSSRGPTGPTGATGATGATGSTGATGATGPGYAATSTSSVAIASSGSKTFTTQSGLAYSAGARVRVADTAAPSTNYMEGVVTSYSGTTLTFTADRSAGSGTLSSWTINLVGDVGATGSTGSTGATGPVAATSWDFSTTTTDSDPGNGTVRFNNATPASVTTIYFDNVDRDGNTVTSWLDSFDDSTTTTPKGTLTVVPHLLPANKIIFTVSGSVVDGTGYRKVTVAHVAGTTLPSNGAALGFVFARAGDKGTDGAGTGDVTAAANFATDNVVIRSDGVTKGVQASVINIDDTTGTMYPTTNDSGALGKATQSWSDLFLASGAVINFANGNATLTHSSGLATWSVPVSVGTSNAITCGTIELGAASDTTLARSAAGRVTIEGNEIAQVGKQTIFIPAGAMISNTTNGPSSGAVEMTTNKNMFRTLDFDTSTSESAQFEVWFPKSWNLSTVTFQPIWSHASTATNFGVVWELSGVARSDDDAGDVAFGTGQTSTDTGGTTNDIYLGPESSAITIAGTPAAGDTVQFKIARLPANVSDTLAIDARLHGVRVFFTTNAPNDA